MNISIKDSVFCFTGELDFMTREIAKNKVISSGGTVTDFVSKNVTFLVTNNPVLRTAKHLKAIDLGVKIIDEKKFIALF